MIKVGYSSEVYGNINEVPISGCIGFLVENLDEENTLFFGFKEDQENIPLQSGQNRPFKASENEIIQGKLHFKNVKKVLIIKEYILNQESI